MSIITSILNQYGESLTYRAITRSFNDRGDKTEATSDSSKAFIVQVMSGDEQQVQSGELEIGEAVAFCEATETISIGDRIQYQSTWYEIVGAVKERTGSTNHFWDLRLKRFNE